MQSTSTSAWIARIDPDSWARLNAPATAAPEPASHVPLEPRTATSLGGAVGHGRLRWRHSDGRTLLRTVMSLEVFATLAATGAVTGRPQSDDEQFTAAYEWMRWQMARHLPHYRGEYPMWAWARIPRTALIDILDDATGILITHAAQHDRMLLSDEALYMDVLNGTRTLPDDLADDNAADAYITHWQQTLADAGHSHLPWWELPAHLLHQILDTWEPIIYPDTRGHRYVQACVPAIHAADVIDAVQLPAPAA